MVSSIVDRLHSSAGCGILSLTHAPYHSPFRVTYIKGAYSSVHPPPGSTLAHLSRAMSDPLGLFFCASFGRPR